MRYNNVIFKELLKLRRKIKKKIEIDTILDDTTPFIKELL